MQAFGWTTSTFSTDNYWGFTIGLNIDAGLNYELPLYNIDQYVIWRVLTHAFAGGRQYLTVQLGYVKLHLFVDLWGVKMTFFDNFMRYDIVTYDKFCDTAKWLLRVAFL